MKRRLPVPSLRQRIPSRLEEIDAFCVRIRSLLNANGLERVCFPVELLARESLNNAVIHGNRKDARKSVQLSLSIGRVWIRLEVRDQGAGFPWRKVCLNRFDTAACSGRGLQLYALYAARKRFNRSGNQITLWIGKGSSQMKRSPK